MSSANDLRTRLVPAVCTQCGARLEVDPTHDAAVKRRSPEQCLRLQL